MIDLLSNILDLLYNFFNAVGELLSDIANVIIQVGRAALRLPNLFSWIPPEISGILLTTFTIVVVYKILGREG